MLCFCTNCGQREERGGCDPLFGRCPVCDGLMSIVKVLDDFRSHTCGECAWMAVGHNTETCSCRNRQCEYIALYDRFMAMPACPAYVPRKES